MPFIMVKSKFRKLDSVFKELALFIEVQWDLSDLYLVHTNGECRALNQRAKRRHFCLLFQKCRDLLSNVTL